MDAGRANPEYSYTMLDSETSIRFKLEKKQSARET